MKQIMSYLETASQQKQEKIADKAINQIADNNKRHRKLNIVREKDFAEAAVHISYPHINNGIKTNGAAEKYIKQKPTEKTGKQTGLFSLHKSIRGCKHNQKIRYDSVKA